mgnify:CR=1 FL=1
MDTGIARSEQVYEHLKNLILSRALKPGEKIPEAKLAAQFGLSRTPIREAIKKLANDVSSPYIPIDSLKSVFFRRIGYKKSAWSACLWIL